MKVNHWRNIPETPDLAIGECHLWLAWLDKEDPASFRTILSSDEKLRAERYRNPRSADRFIVARGILRTLLGHYQSCDPDRLIFSYGPHGKPELNPEQGAGISFNVSHSESLGIFAITKGYQVGVDVEEIHPVSDLEATASIFLSPDELAQFMVIPTGKKLERFFNLWTSKEAILKAYGVGFSSPTRDLSTKIREPFPNDCCDEIYENKRITLFTPAKGFRGAIAYL